MVGRATDELTPGEGSQWMSDLDTLVLCYGILCQIKGRVDYNPFVFCVYFANEALPAFLPLQFVTLSVINIPYIFNEII